MRSVERSSAAHASREEGELPDIGIDHGFFGCDREDVLSILFVKCPNGSNGCLAATVVEKARQTTFITSLAFKRILVKSDNERSLLSLASRVSNCLPGVQLVLMTSLDGDHAANGLAEVGVEESA